MSFPFEITEHVIPAQHVREWPRATAVTQEDVLQIHIKQYRPKDNLNPQPEDITVIGAHACGFPKEIYEALWVDFHTQSKKHGFRIRGIWITDVANQGYSGRINKQMLGNDPSGNDAARDLLYMTNVFRSEMPRPIIGIGHSFGASVITQLSLIHPRLFTSLVLLDPSINILEQQTGVISAGQLSTIRRDTWPSREAAEKTFRHSRFHSSWDPRVLDAWITHGICETPDGKATLTTPRDQELFTYFRPLYPYVRADGTLDRDGAPDYDQALLGPPDPHSSFPFYRGESSAVLTRLPHVRPSVLWMFGGASNVNLPLSIRKEVVRSCGSGSDGSGGVAAGRVAEITLEGYGHMFPMEVPGLAASHAATWVGREMQQYREAQREYDEWTRLPMSEKTTMSQQFVDAMGRSLGAEKTAINNSKPKL
ncbi:prolyl aminopeptidase-like protein [Xylaria cf. heliscus]|nr:prolyl aminopeptidase-like protein [Xylaria cf. heliscus]